uniref:1-acyl-sn-glycerol-3-phosphate acyltransferase n=1 Tax=Anser brachyrhynchus TaxID=132585 RepID=A0A8B9BQ54_9AVES
MNPAFRFFCKMCFYKLWVFTISLLVITASIPRGRNCENMKFLSMSFLPLKYIFGIKIVVKGKENLRTKKPFVLVLNHQTSLDIMVMMEILPSRCVAIAKKEILYMGTFGLACWLAGLIFIDRKKREESITTLTEVAHSMHKDNFRVLIFPEGTRNHNGSMLPFKRGAFQLAVKAQVPIIPVVISSYSDFYSQKEKRFTPGEDYLGQKADWLLVRAQSLEGAMRWVGREPHAMWGLQLDKGSFFLFRRRGSGILQEILASAVCFLRVCPMREPGEAAES